MADETQAPETATSPAARPTREALEVQLKAVTTARHALEQQLAECSDECERLEKLLAESK